MTITSEIPLAPSVPVQSGAPLPRVIETDGDSHSLEAGRDGPTEVGYHVGETAIGRLLLLTTSRGLCRVAFERQGHDRILDGLDHRPDLRLSSAPDRLEPALAQLDEYLSGRRLSLDVPLDVEGLSAFRALVMNGLARIPYGKTESYAQLADVLGRPTATRAVGVACASNPLPLFFPCHRVIKSDGSPGGYAGGVEVKRHLLKLESPV